MRVGVRVRVGVCEGRSVRVRVGVCEGRRVCEGRCV